MELPDGWKWVKLDDLCNLITDGTHKTPKYTTEGIPFVSTANLDPKRKGFVFSNYKKFISLIEHNELIKRCEPKKGDVLISKCGTIGRTKMIDVDYEFSIFVGLALLKIKKDIISGKYMEKILNSERFKKELGRASPGSSRKTLTIQSIKKFKFPLPPLPTQKKIVAILEKTEELKRLREEADKWVGEFLQSVFLEMFGDPIKNPKGWDTITLEQGCKEIYRYPTFYGFKYVKTGIPVIKISNMGENWLFSEDLDLYDKISPEVSMEYPRTIVAEGDVVMEVRGTYLGKCVIIPKKLKGAHTNPNTLRISLKPELILPEYFYWLSLTRAWDVMINKISRYWKAGFGTIKSEALKLIKIPLPPISLQNKFATFVEKVERMKGEQVKSKGEIDNLFNALMQKAFKGELVA